ncbi:hypothetical protein QTO34_012775 [Cnephaeus nilssonii]|uniref:Uncharacterized protein n=1 Tax=Cnephaeus nilssonii TaxID=3371016 RepID=A0AA40HAV2_CNENI|nr:hypothetical protein QTO34_012775 [Eptesicus nilssonii]
MASLGCKERETVATLVIEMSMNDARLLFQPRDYCAHYRIQRLNSRRDRFPNFQACKREQHAGDACEHLD